MVNLYNKLGSRCLVQVWKPDTQMGEQRNGVLGLWCVPREHISCSHSPRRALTLFSLTKTTYSQLQALDSKLSSSPSRVTWGSCLCAALCCHLRSSSSPAPTLPSFPHIQLVHCALLFRGSSPSWPCSPLQLCCFRKQFWFDNVCGGLCCVSLVYLRMMFPRILSPGWFWVPVGSPSFGLQKQSRDHCSVKVVKSAGHKEGQVQNCPLGSVSPPPLLCVQFILWSLNTAINCTEEAAFIFISF
jgi:hypothetical protein